MAESLFKKFVHTEHSLFECWVGDHNAPNVQLFRAPTVHDGSGSHKRLPHKISWNDLVENDIIVAVEFADLDDEKQIMPTLQFWHVLEVEDGSARVLVNNIVGSAGDGEYVYDRLAGLVGCPPSTPDKRLD